MKPAEAVELVAFLRAAFPNMTDDQESVYARLLEAENDVAAASKAILDGVNVWRFPPAYAQVREAIRIEKDRRRVDEPRAPDPVRDGPLPFWVVRWCCARFLYGAREQDKRPFPEQFPRGVPPGIELMPADEWVAEAEKVNIADAWKAIRANTGGMA